MRAGATAAIGIHGCSISGFCWRRIGDLITAVVEIAAVTIVDHSKSSMMCGPGEKIQRHVGHFTMGFVS